MESLHMHSDDQFSLNLNWSPDNRHQFLWRKQKLQKVGSRVSQPVRDLFLGTTTKSGIFQVGAGNPTGDRQPTFPVEGCFNNGWILLPTKKQIFFLLKKNLWIQSQIGGGSKCIKLLSKLKLWEEAKKIVGQEQTVTLYLWSKQNPWSTVLSRMTPF